MGNAIDIVVVVAGVNRPLTEADGSIVTSPPLWIRAAGQIRRTKVVIHGKPVLLIFPTPPGPGSSKSHIQPLQEPPYRGRPIPELKIAPSAGWGNFDSKADALLVKALRFVAPLEANPTTMSTTGVMDPRRGSVDWLRVAWPPWFELARDWLCAWTGLVRGQVYSSESPRIIDAAAERYGIERPGSVQIGTSIASHGQVFPAASADQVRAAFLCATNGTSVPVAFDLLMDAQTAHLHGRYRQCVIDACTAAEASLSERIQNNLANGAVPSDARETITKQTDGVVGLARLAVSMGVSVPVSSNAISHRLAGPRNMAVHVGSSLDGETATAAFRLARELVLAVNPLPSPASVLRRNRRT